MAVGLIKKQIIHSDSKESPLKLPKWLGGKGTKNRQRLDAAEKAYKAQLGEYEAQEFQNVYAGAQNQFAGMENVFEDVTINQQAAEFQRQQAQQSQANILGAITAGGSFSAGNIQALAAQGQRGAQAAAADIGRQEQQGRQLAMQESSRVQQLERQGRGQADLLRMQGAGQVQQMELDKQATLLGMSMQEVGNAQAAIAANKAMWGEIIGGVTSAVGSVAAGGLIPGTSG